MLFYLLKLEYFRYGTNFTDYLKKITKGREVPDVAKVTELDNHPLYSSVKNYLLGDGKTFLRVAEQRRITEYGPKPGTLDIVVVTTDPYFVEQLNKESYNGIERILTIPMPLKEQTII